MANNFLNSPLTFSNQLEKASGRPPAVTLEARAWVISLTGLATYFRTTVRSPLFLLGR
ncbi:hypothetical protein M4D81_24505 [Paenibacillus sp. p3-SID867]|uniref:hypothetical protein n=1 Tax=Paenibacillus sp. p3-SID867 TaxID=2916363 RepID=UPI0021A4F02F|nr:hypothetical protein [Paenibacillus sp. p3-SID867]MCT1402162.1 hypothetical protein [Paenibacillus sp. p3-SID867]